MIKKLQLFLLLLLFINTALAQVDSVSYSEVRINKAYIKSGFLDTRDVFLSPIKWKSKQWITAGAIIGVTAVGFTQDLNIQDFFQRNRSNLTNDISKFGFEPFGSGLYSMPIIGGLYIYGVLGENTRAKKVGMLGVKAFLISGAVNYVFKQAIHRHRPYQVEEELKNNKIMANTQYEWDGPFSSFEYTSFPSGHTVAAFAVATIIASEYKDHSWVPVLSYTLATLTGLSRINDNKHWGSDVLIGAALGWGMGKLIYNRNNWGLKVLPYATSNVTGMLISLPIQ